LDLFIHRLDMVEIRGKRGRRVPVILAPQMITSISLLNSTRKAVGIPEGNRYIFARVNQGSLDHIRAWGSLNKYVEECEQQLERPNAITSTKLRKYVATITQVLTLQ